MGRLLSGKFLSKFSTVSFADCNILRFSNQGETDKENPDMDTPDRIHEDVLDSAVLGGEAELGRHQHGVGIEGDQSRRKTHPAQVTGHEITPEGLNLRVYIYLV